jgi:hypothetical protein
MVDVSGRRDEGFGKVKDAFAENSERNGDVGTSFAFAVNVVVNPAGATPTWSSTEEALPRRVEAQPRRRPLLRTVFSPMEPTIGEALSPAGPRTSQARQPGCRACRRPDAHGEDAPRTSLG